MVFLSWHIHCFLRWVKKTKETTTLGMWQIILILFGGFLCLVWLLWHIILRWHIMNRFGTDWFIVVWLIIYIMIIWTLLVR